jgi:ABC-type dipeptide/oligopeptide/nickel transport system permease component
MARTRALELTQRRLPHRSLADRTTTGGARSRAARRRYDRWPLTTAPTAMADSPRARRRPRPSASFLRFLLRRAAALVLLAVGITLVVFVLTQLVPSNAVATNLGEQAAADPAAVAAFKAHFGLDKPLPVRYWLYLKHLAQGDLGQSSLTHDAVTHDLGQFIPATAELALYSIVIAAVFGIAFGVIAALRRNRPVDHVLRVVSLGGISMPTFWIALVALYLGFFRLGWFPGAERLDPGVLPPPHKSGLYTVDALLAGQWGLFVQALHHLVLPALVLAAFSVGLLTRYTRSAVLEVVGNDYVRAARAKGLPERVVVTRYILRAALPSVVTVLGLVFANVLTGAVLVEKIFSWPGIGQYAYQAAVNLDVPAIAGVSLFVAVVYITVNFIVDVLYGVIDPRIRVR